MNTYQMQINNFPATIAQPIIVTSKRNLNLKEKVSFLRVYPSFPTLGRMALPFLCEPMDTGMYNLQAVLCPQHLPQYHNPTRGLWVPLAGHRCGGRRSHSSDCGCPALCQLSPTPRGKRERQ